MNLGLIRMGQILEEIDDVINRQARPFLPSFLSGWIADNVNEDVGMGFSETEAKSNVNKLLERLGTESF